jgi:23S rRNA (pseudouridine1915-N3)-methyltransferase
MEKGKQFTSVDFSKWLFEKSETQKIIFIIGGAAGHGEEVIAKANFKLSLSELTYPHKLARLLLVEQIYRAITIKNNHPYNK